jgi:hypothetical protein
MYVEFQPQSEESEAAIESAANLDNEDERADSKPAIVPDVIALSMPRAHASG